MRQILQNLRDGTTELAEVPCPALPPGHLLLRTTRSLISAGTERMLVDFGKAGLISKARQQPEKVRMVLDKVRTDGLATTIAAVRNKLDQPLPLGYCNVGRVIEIGAGVKGYAVGDRVASNGKHAEIVSVPTNLCARVPEQVGDDAAAFAVLGAIALQGIRLVQPTLGETVAVSGLGLIGLLTVQLLRAHGCRVLGLDFDAGRLALARSFGAEGVDLGAGADPVAAATGLSRGNGIDAVIVTASTRSSEPVRQAALMCRKRGRIVMVGVTGLELSRADFYEKELTFQVSCSYGPGRYDAAYEQKGLDYPIGFVRWTEQRNFEAVLDMLADGRLDVSPLVSHAFPIEEAEKAYAIITGSEPSLGVMLAYPDESVRPDAEVAARTVTLPPRPRRPLEGAATVGFVGSGNYATGVLIPAFKAAGATLKSVASSTGVSGMHAGRKFGFEQTTTDIDALLSDDTVDAVVITTRHDSHAQLAVRALDAGKHVFVEKPLALDLAQLEQVGAAYETACTRGASPVLMVGFNRRFSPLVVRMKQQLAASSGPKSMVMTVNAGAIPAGHWAQDAELGGGRIIGEACHFIDLLRHLAGCRIVKTHTEYMDSQTGDTATMTLGFADGTIGTIHYFANGSRDFPKERLEVFTGGRVMTIDNFRSLSAFGTKGFRNVRLWRQDKGQAGCVSAFLAAVTSGGPSPIPFDETLEVARATIAMAEQLDD